MKRRKFIGAGLVVGGATLAAACGQQNKPKQTAAKQTAAIHRQKINWRMATSWPKDSPALGTGANRLAQHITALSDGEIEITVHGAGEIVPPLGVFDAVAKGTVDLGHGASYYWKGKVPAAQFFTTVPFGLTAQEMNGWIYYGGGQKLWDELYAPFNLKPFLAGNSGVQMGGWFNRDIQSLADIKGLTMRISGLGSDVIDAVGGTPRFVPGGEIFTALQSGVIDAAEWVGPYIDLAFGLYKAAQYYYYPGWHEPGPAIEFIVNKTAFDALPPRLQKVIAVAAQAANADVLAEFTARNGTALNTLINEHHVQLRRFPDDVLKRFKIASEDVVRNFAQTDAASQKIYSAYAAYRRAVTGWTALSEMEYVRRRDHW